MLERLFGSASRAKIIKFFCTHKGRFYLREIARALDIKVSALSRELDNLEHFGFLVASTSGQKKYYVINESFVLLPELKSLIVKSMLLLEKAVIRDITKLKGIQIFIMTGIFSNQETGTDLLIVGSIRKKRIQNIVLSFSRSFFQDIRFTVLSPSEYRFRLDVNDKFLYRIMNQSPIVVVNKYAR